MYTAVHKTYYQFSVSALHSIPQLQQQTWLALLLHNQSQTAVHPEQSKMEEVILTGEVWCSTMAPHQFCIAPDTE